MKNPNMKMEIKTAAVELFDHSGYHGTSIRNIAKHVGCSLPMVYYYYENKQMLFHEIISEDYFALLARLAKDLETSSLVDYYTSFLSRIIALSEYDRMIYRLGIKVYLGFDGDEPLQTLMQKWEASIVPRHKKIIAPHLSENAPVDMLVHAFTHLMESLIESIVVRGKNYTEEECRAELSVLFKPYIQ